jgi:hypothetical protein
MMIICDLGFGRASVVFLLNSRRLSQPVASVVLFVIGGNHLSNSGGNLGAMFVNREQLTGGASLCGAYKFHNYDNREWFQHDFPTLMEDAALSIGTMLTPEVAELMPIRNMMGAIAKSTGVEDDERDYGRVELLALEGGDKISLGLDVIGGTRPVIYVNQNALDKRLVISTCFDEFLLAWEQLCYITPSLDNLSPLVESREWPTESSR